MSLLDVVWTFPQQDVGVFLTWVLAWTVIWHVVLGVGITVGYHRLLTHQGFKTHRWVEYALVTLGYLAFQGPPAQWVAIHRIHHAYSDKPLDPHSPVGKGWFYAQIGWIFDRRREAETDYQTFNAFAEGEQHQGKPAYCYRWSPDLVDDPYYGVLERMDVFVVFIALSLVAAWALGGWVGLLGRVLAGFTSFSCTGWVNSFCHLPCWGATAPFQAKTKDESKNVWWVALVTMGEGWHNNHHAFQRSACHGLRWWQVDVSWYAICLLRALRLAWGVYRPTDETLRMTPQAQPRLDKRESLTTA